MFRVILGTGGLALIALGVFGGAVLENIHQVVHDFYKPDTVIAHALPDQSDNVLKSNKQGHAPGEQPSPLASTDAVTAQPSLDASDDVTEVQASSKNSLLVKTAIDNGERLVGTGENDLPKEAQIKQVVETTTGSAKNTLFVLKDRVNLREGPSIEHGIVLQLKLGQELMEFKREGRWVHVGAYGTSGKIGWVHGTLVGENVQ